MYLDSIKELFPQRLQARCLNAGEDSALVSDLRSQQDQYAAAYLGLHRAGGGKSAITPIWTSLCSPTWVFP